MNSKIHGKPPVIDCQLSKFLSETEIALYFALNTLNSTQAYIFTLFKCNIFPFVPKCLLYAGSINFLILSFEIDPYRFIHNIRCIINVQKRSTPLLVANTTVYNA